MPGRLHGPRLRCVRRQLLPPRQRVRAVRARERAAAVDADAEAAIYGAIMMHATRMLGNDVLRGLTSPMGDVTAATSAWTLMRLLVKLQSNRISASRYSHKISRPWNAKSAANLIKQDW